jgi:hypothetical protein
MHDYIERSWCPRETAASVVIMSSGLAWTVDCLTGLIGDPASYTILRGCPIRRKEERRRQEG